MIKIKSTVLAAIIIFFASMLLAADAPDEVPRPPEPIYMVVYEAGFAYLPGRPFAEQPGIMEHAAYMDQLEDDGMLIFGGPFFDGLEPPVMTGATIFLKAGSETEAREIVDRDPAITHGMLSLVVVKPFMAMIGGD